MRVKIRRALLSVSDKTRIDELALALHEFGVELISSSNTAAAIAAAGVPVTPISEVTGFPEILGHRVVTLNPACTEGSSPISATPSMSPSSRLTASRRSSSSCRTSIRSVSAPASTRSTSVGPR